MNAKNSKDNAEKIKQIIADYEMQINGWYKLCGRSVEVLNVHKIADGYQADVILHNDEDQEHERYDACFYHFQMFRDAKTGEEL